MNHQSRHRLLPAFLLAALFFNASACQKKKVPEEQVLPMDRIAPTPADTTRTVLRKSFALSTSVNFPFDVPSHAAMPRLHGNYRSFVRQLGVQPNDDTANVDFLILNEDQYADFIQGHAGEAFFSAGASHDQDVNVTLPPTQDQPRKYYLVFRNSPGDTTKKAVQADFTLDF
jgi:hypothetical protein